MADVLKSAVVFGGTGNGGSLFGLVTLFDNHGNSTRFDKLTCKGKPPYQMTTSQTYALHGAIDPYAFRAVTFDGTIPLPDGVESPLQTACHLIAAGKFHAAKASPPIHSK